MSMSISVQCATNYPKLTTITSPIVEHFMCKISPPIVYSFEVSIKLMVDPSISPSPTTSLSRKSVSSKGSLDISLFEIVKPPTCSDDPTLCDYVVKARTPKDCPTHL